MVLWQCDLRISWLAQRLSLLLHGVTVTALLLLPWPLIYVPLLLLLLSLIVFDCICSQRRIYARRGMLMLMEDKRIGWQGKEWKIMGSPWLLPGGMLLILRIDKKTQRLWLAKDSMVSREWRDLRRLLYTRSQAQR